MPTVGRVAKTAAPIIQLGSAIPLTTLGLVDLVVRAKDELRRDFLGRFAGSSVAVLLLAELAAGAEWQGVQRQSRGCP